MNPTLDRAFAVALPVAALIAATAIALVRARTVHTICWFIGATCLAIVVLTHIAEGMRWFPVMRWGQPDSSGHYLDLTSAIGSVLFLVAGTVARLAVRAR